MVDGDRHSVGGESQQLEISAAEVVLAARREHEQPQQLAPGHQRNHEQAGRRPVRAGSGR